MNWLIRVYYVKNFIYEFFIVIELLILFWLGFGFYFLIGIVIFNKLGLIGILFNFCSNYFLLF